MTQTINVFWEALKDTVDFYKNQDPNITFEESKKEAFYKAVQDKYDCIKDTYMVDSLESKTDNKNKSYLDRHKLAAIFIVAAIENELVGYSNPENNKVFIGCEMFITEVAWSWMIARLNENLQELGVKKRIETLVMPQAFACQTPYFDIFCRELYYAKNSKKLFELAIADSLFLLEYITLLDKKINPQLLCKYEDKNE